MQSAQGDLPAALTVLSRQPRDRGPAGESPTPATPAGSATCRCRTTRSATCRSRRAISPGALTSYQATPRDRRPAGDSRPRQCRLAARPVGVVQQGRRRAGRAGRSAGGAEHLSGTASRSADRLATADPGNAGWQRDLSVSDDKDRRRAGRAGQSRRRAEKLSGEPRDQRPAGEGGPGNAGWQRDLSVSYSKLASVFSKTGQSDKAREALIAGRAILTGLIVQHPDWAEWKQDAAWFDEQLDQLREAIGDAVLARAPAHRDRPHDRLGCVGAGAAAIGEAHQAVEAGERLDLRGAFRPIAAPARRALRRGFRAWPRAAASPGSRARRE